MEPRKISVILLIVIPLQILAQVELQPEEPTQWVPPVEELEREQTFFQGFSLTVDLVQPVMMQFSDFGGVEAALRINLKNTFFPVVELGYSDGEKTDDNTAITYAVSAPFLRAGLDINMLRDKWQDNKLFVGLRYGFTTFSYDMSGPAVEDPVWGGTEPFGYDGIDCTVQTLEIIVGVQAKIWKNLHMGWFVRYKRILSQTDNVYSEPYYIPGYGTTTGGCAWGFNYALTFDLNWGKGRKSRAALPPPPILLDNDTEEAPLPKEGSEADEKEEIITEEEDAATGEEDAVPEDEEPRPVEKGTAPDGLFFDKDTDE